MRLYRRSVPGGSKANTAALLRRGDRWRRQAQDWNRPSRLVVRPGRCLYSRRQRILAFTDRRHAHGSALTHCSGTVPPSTGRRMRHLRLASITLGLPLLLVACAPLSAGLGGDPCLLQQYQSRSFSLIGRLHDALVTLTDHVAALQAPQGAITASPDISETLTALSEFTLGVATQRNLVDTGAQPPEGRSFHATLHRAMARFDTGAEMLSQAYVDAQNSDSRPATAIATAARAQLERGRLLLGVAGTSVTALKTYSPNC